MENNMIIENVYYLPSGRIFVARLDDGYKIEFTEMRDVAVDGKLHKEVRELKHDNKQLAKEIEGRVNHLRKSGM